MKYNKGEWTEFLVILSLCINAKFTLYEEDSESFHTVKSVVYNANYTIDISESMISVNKKEIDEGHVTSVAKEIKKYLSLKQKSTFEIPMAKDMIKKYFGGERFKGKSSETADSSLLTELREMNFSTKGYFGSPPTILNTSAITRIRYILPRIDWPTDGKLYEKIKSTEVESPDFEYNSPDFENNLFSIHRHLPCLVANILWRRYFMNEKKIENLLNDKEKEIWKLFYDRIFDGWKPKSGDTTIKSDIVISAFKNGFLSETKSVATDNWMKVTIIDTPSTKKAPLNIQQGELNTKITLHLQIRMIKWKNNRISF